MSAFAALNTIAPSTVDTFDKPIESGVYDGKIAYARVYVDQPVKKQGKILDTETNLETVYSFGLQPIVDGKKLNIVRRRVSIRSERKIEKKATRTKPAVYGPWTLEHDSVLSILASDLKKLGWTHDEWPGDLALQDFATGADVRFFAEPVNAAGYQNGKILAPATPSVEAETPDSVDTDIPF